MSRKIPLSDEEEQQMKENPPEEPEVVYPRPYPPGFDTRKDFAEVPYHEFRIDDSTEKVARRVVLWPF